MLKKLGFPTLITDPVAAILYVNGHSPTQSMRYQPYPAKFAKLGFVCLIIETIQFGEVRGHHHGCYANGWFNWYSRGYNPGEVELWNAIRGLDLLASRPEVDPEKMGITDISGGGSQSWYIAAADPRVMAVAPVCGASTLKAQIGKRTVDGHCDCMMPTNTYQADFQDIGALIALRPLLIAQADRDGMNTIESIRELHSDIKKLYDLYGEEENISLVETPGGHSYHQISREKIHSFFLKHLIGKDVAPEEAGDIDLSPDSQFSAEELKGYTNGAPENDRTPTIQNSFLKLAEAPEISTKNELNSYRDSAKNFPDRVIPVSAPGSYDKPGAVYKLTNDIVSERSAIFLDENVTLDLNGYTITDTGGDYEHVPNYGFEEGISGWDISKAPNAPVFKPVRMGSFEQKICVAENVELPEYSVDGNEKKFFSPFTILTEKKKKTVHLNQNRKIEL